MLVGQCTRCGTPATLGCTLCGRTFCRACLDADERMCADCATTMKNSKSPVGARLPPSRRLAGRPVGRAGRAQ